MSSCLVSVVAGRHHIPAGIDRFLRQDLNPRFYGYLSALPAVPLWYGRFRAGDTIVAANISANALAERAAAGEQLKSDDLADRRESSKSAKLLGPLSWL